MKFWVGFLAMPSSIECGGGDLALFRSWNLAPLAVTIVPELREATNDATAEASLNKDPCSLTHLEGGNWLNEGSLDG